MFTVNNKFILLRIYSSMKHASLSRQTVVLPPSRFCTIRNQDVNAFCTKTCLVPFVKPFHSFKLKSVLYSYSLTKGISHVCAPPWFESEEVQRSVFLEISFHLSM